MEPRPQMSFIESDGQESESDGNVDTKHLFGGGAGADSPSPPKKNLQSPKRLPNNVL